MRVFVFCLFLGAVLTTPIRDEDIQKYIAGGNNAAPGQFPFQVAVVVRKTGSAGSQFTSFCGGSLISDEWVLTAAHCLINSLGADIYLGSTDLSIGEPQRIVQNIPQQNLFIYDKYMPNQMRNDIALVKLSQRVPLNRYIQTVNLPKRSQLSEMFINKIGWISGWGKVSDQIGSTAELQFTRRRILPHNYCYSDFGSLFVPETQVCVDGSNRIGACQGDSGGPLIAVERDGTPVLIGASAYGKVWCGRGNPSVYTRVSAFMDWIVQKTGIQMRE